MHAVTPKRVSLIAFCATNVFIDVEVLYYLLTHQYPLHRFFHTFIGVSIVIALTIAIAAGLLRMATRIELPNPFNWQQLTLLPVAVGSALGGYSHVVLDGVMHPDIRPFAPFSDGNPFYLVVSLGTLHWFCVAAALVGMAALWLRERQNEAT